MNDDYLLGDTDGGFVTSLRNRKIDYNRRASNFFKSSDRGRPKDHGKNAPVWNLFWKNPDSHADFFDLQGHRREELPYYEEAEESAVQCRQQLSTWTDKRKARIQIGKDGTAPSKSFFADLRKSATALANEDHIALIDDAATHYDEEFFVKMAAVIKARWKRKPPNLLKLQIAYCWTKCLLWLMTDDAAMIFMRSFVRFDSPKSSTLTVMAYTKAKQEMDLFQHPNPPITGVTVQGKLRIGREKKEFRFVDVK